MKQKVSVNAYVCENLHATVTSYKDSGTTPMFILCPICETRAVSKMGMINQALEANYEWYKPTDKEIIEDSKIVANKYNLLFDDVFITQQQYVKNGGLLMRKIKN
jgi:hypothetical protein